MTIDLVDSPALVIEHHVHNAAACLVFGESIGRPMAQSARFADGHLKMALKAATETNDPRWFRILNARCLCWVAMAGTRQ